MFNHDDFGDLNGHLLPEVHWREARPELTRILREGLTAVDPQRHNRRIPVSCKPEEHADHILFKGKEEGATSRTACDEFYRCTHGERIHWIRIALESPSRIWLEKKKNGCYIYVLDEPEPHRKFVVVVGATRNRNGLWLRLVSAYDYDLTDREDLRHWRARGATSDIVYEKSPDRSRG